MIIPRSGRRAIALLGLLLVVLAVSCSDSPPPARTYFESLDLSEPVNAASEFVDAYAHDDFFRVWLVMGREAQSDAMALFSFRQFGDLIDTTAFDDFEQAWPGPDFSLDDLESFDTWYYFDQLMLFADEHDALLFDFTGEEPLTPVTPTSFSVPLEGGGEVIIETSEIVDRWRVWSVTYPAAGGETASWPRDPTE